MAGVMAKARLLPDALLRSREFAALQDDSALAFLMLLPHWDRDGLLDGDAAWELPKLMHYRDDLSRRMVAFIENWERVGLIVSYQAGGRRILYWRKFRVHNANIVTSREAPSRFPPPPNYTRDAAGLIPESENEIQEMIFELDPRSAYRVALERALRVKLHGAALPYPVGNDDNSLSNHDNSLSNHDLSLRGRADHHNQNQSVVDDQSDHNALPFVKVRGDARGGGAGQVDSLGELDRVTLERLALEAGSFIGLLGEWSGYLEYITALEDTPLIELIQWIAHYADLPNEAKEKIASQTAVIRAHLNRNEHATLRKSARDWINRILDRMMVIGGGSYDD